MPLDILVPYWGDPSLLRTTVESVLAQTDPGWTLTVVDDAYPDLTAGEYLSGIDDPRVRYVRNETNLGLAGNFQRCLDLATEDLVVFPGCDDLLDPGYAATVLAAAERFPQATVVQPGVRVVDQDGNPASTLVDTVKQRFLAPRSRTARLLSGESAMVGLMRGNWLYWPSLTFRREAVASVGFREGFPVVLDLALVVDLLTAGGSVLRVPEVCFAYRRHTGSASSEAAVDGSRFAEERRYFALAATQAVRLGWRRAARAARRHTTSRAHALAQLPAAVRSGHRAAVGEMVRHAIGPTRP
ncbi:MAG: glycosyltransferase [Micrococcales bacterium]|nr:glycosyltransferase [Micrococcales bacterium]